MQNKEQHVQNNPLVNSQIVAEGAVSIYKPQSLLHRPEYQISTTRLRSPPAPFSDTLLSTARTSSNIHGLNLLALDLILSSATMQLLSIWAVALAVNTAFAHPSTHIRSHQSGQFGCGIEPSDAYLSNLAEISTLEAADSGTSRLLALGDSTSITIQPTSGSSPRTTPALEGIPLLKLSRHNWMCWTQISPQADSSLSWRIIAMAFSSTATGQWTAILSLWESRWDEEDTMLWMYTSKLDSTLVKVLLE